MDASEISGIFSKKKKKSCLSNKIHALIMK